MDRRIDPTIRRHRPQHVAADLTEYIRQVRKVGSPLVYVFDDSFSALDVATDARLRGALDATAAGTTRIVVAQRVATITEADQIIVLDEGRVVGRGTHAELLADNQTYREIVDSQLTAEDVA